MPGLLRFLVERTQRHWTARCLTCGLRFPYPSIRIGAAARLVKLLPCPRCGRWRCCRVEPIAAASDATGSAAGG